MGTLNNLMVLLGVNIYIEQAVQGIVVLAVVYSFIRVQRPNFERQAFQAINFRHGGTRSAAKTARDIRYRREADIADRGSPRRTWAERDRWPNAGNGGLRAYKARQGKV
jgi:hypothetical protein